MTESREGFCWADTRRGAKGETVVTGSFGRCSICETGRSSLDPGRDGVVSEPDCRGGVGRALGGSAGDVRLGNADDLSVPGENGGVCANREFEVGA